MQFNVCILQIGSYKKLEEIGADLQNVEHHKRCMPVKYQLGAALYSEDKKWYRLAVWQPHTYL